MRLLTVLFWWIVLCAYTNYKSTTVKMRTADTCCLSETDSIIPAFKVIRGNRKIPLKVAALPVIIEEMPDTINILEKDIVGLIPEVAEQGCVIDTLIWEYSADNGNRWQKMDMPFTMTATYNNCLLHFKAKCRCGEIISKNSRLTLIPRNTRPDEQ